MAGARREHVPSDGIVRLLLQPCLADFHRLVDFAECVVRERQQPSRFWMPRPERDHLGEAKSRLALSLLAVQQNAEVVVRVRVVGIYTNCGSIGRFRFNDSSLGSEHHAEIAVSIGVIRVECNRLLVRPDCLVQVEPILEDDAEIAVPVRPLGLELETSLDQSDGLFAPRLLMGENPREVKRVSVVGRDFEDPAVDLPSGRPLLRLLQHDRDRQRLVEAQRAVVGRLRRPDYPSLWALMSYLK